MVSSLVFDCVWEIEVDISYYRHEAVEMVTEPEQFVMNITQYDDQKKSQKTRTFELWRFMGPGQSYLLYHCTNALISYASIPIKHKYRQG